MEKSDILIKRYKNKKWRPFPGNELPENAIKYLTKPDPHCPMGNNPWKSGYGSWIQGMVYFAGSDNPEDATEWCIVFDDGDYYKCNAIFSFWHPLPNGDVGLQCVWSYSHLKKTVRNFLETGKTLSDPGYQT